MTTEGQTAEDPGDLNLFVSLYESCNREFYYTENIG